VLELSDGEQKKEENSGIARSDERKRKQRGTEGTKETEAKGEEGEQSTKKGREEKVETDVLNAPRSLKSRRGFGEVRS